MKLGKLILAFLIAPLVTPLVIMSTSLLLEPPFPLEEVGSWFIAVAVFAYLATAVFGIPAFLIYRWLKWTHPLLYVLGGGVIGAAVSIILNRSAVSIIFVVAGALSGLVFRVLIGRIRPAVEPRIPIESETLLVSAGRNDQKFQRQGPIQLSANRRAL